MVAHENGIHGSGGPHPGRGTADHGLAGARCVSVCGMRAMARPTPASACKESMDGLVLGGRRLARGNQVAPQNDRDRARQASKDERDGKEHRQYFGWRGRNGGLGMGGDVAADTVGQLFGQIMVVERGADQLQRHRQRTQAQQHTTQERAGRLLTGGL